VPRVIGLYVVSMRVIFTHGRRRTREVQEVAEEPCRCDARADMGNSPHQRGNLPAVRAPCGAVDGPGTAAMLTDYANSPVSCADVPTIDVIERQDGHGRMEHEAVAKYRYPACVATFEASYMKVHEIMNTPVVTCGPDTTLSAAARLMREANYGTLPVLDRQQHLAGIITDRDICLALAGTARPAAQIPVSQVMSRRVVTVPVTAPVKAALTAMERAHLRRLPVVDHFNHLKGMLSIEDIVMHGLATGGFDADDLIVALRTIYERRPAVVACGRSR
jgi:CBS domain-containing protein